MKGVKRKFKFVQQVKNTPNNRLEKNKEVSLDTSLHIYKNIMNFI